MSFPKILYTPVDRRYNLAEVPAAHQQKIKQQAKSVACIVRKHDIPQRADGTYELSNRAPYHQWVQRAFRYPLGEHERFRDEPNPGLGTAFLVGSRYVLTAAHCVCKNNSSELDQNQIGKTALVFGFRMKNPHTCRLSFKTTQVYHIRSVPAHAWNPDPKKGADWALVELDRDVEGRAPLTLNFRDRVVKDTGLYMLGHPLGLPIKYTDDADVVEDRQTHSFQTQIDAFAGNSGSPVFDAATDQVVGILIKGLTDHEFTNQYKGLPQQRIQVHRATADEIAAFKGEICQRISNLGFINDLLVYIERAPPPLPDPANRGEIRSGLNIAGKCPLHNQAGGMTILSKGFANKFVMSEECARAACQECNAELEDAVTVYLSDCAYQIEGKPQMGNKVKTDKMTVLHNQTFAFVLTDWLYANISVERRR